MASQTIKEKFVELQKSMQIPQNSRPKIQRVVDRFRNRKNFEKHYSPKFVSLGPIHHDNPDLKKGEKYKLMWASKYIENTGHNPEVLHKKIEDNIDELKGHFDDDVLASTRRSLAGFRSLEEKLSWMLFVDGCSLLHILERAKLDEPGQMNIKVDQLVLVMMDVLLLENQLPYQVLKLLWKDEDDSGLIKRMINFFTWYHWERIFTRHHWATPDESQSENKKDMVPKRKAEGEHSLSIRNESQSETPFHLLDLQLTIILIASTPKIKNNEANKENMSKKSRDIDKVKMIYTSIKDLKALGIRLKSSKTRRPGDIDFSEGWFAAELTLPEIVVDDTSAAAFLNLIAYEMCPDFNNDYGFCSFAAFMCSLINHPEDVKVLRSKGILRNSLGSDEEVAQLFNIIGTDLVPNSETYFEVKAKMNDHYNKYKTWIVQGYYSYFSIAAFIALALTFIQTVFTVYPAFKKDG